MTAPAMAYVIDASEPARKHLGTLLWEAGFLVDTFSSGPAFLEVCGQLSPGCVIADLRMPGMDGFELVRRLTSRGGDYPTILLASDCTIAEAVKALKAGAADFIGRPYGDELLLKAVRSALENGPTTRSEPAGRDFDPSRLKTLTGREWDILRGVVDGKTNKTIARDYGISPRTVEVHRAKLMAKSEARSISELVRVALTAGYAGQAPGRIAGPS